MATEPNRIADSQEGRNTITAQALDAYAAGLRKRSRTRTYQGRANAAHRANLRAWADAADELAAGVREGTYALARTFDE